MKRLIDWLFRKRALDGCGAGVSDGYMHRWMLLPPLPNGRRLYLHHFLGDDWSKDMHDHPKAFFSIGLWGSYVEERPRELSIGILYSVPPGGAGIPVSGIARDTYRAPWIRRFPPHHIHRLVEAKGCWTLVYTGPTVHPWGCWRVQDLGARGSVTWKLHGGDEC